MFKRTRIGAAAAAVAGGLALVGAPAFAQEAQRVEITGSSIKRIEGETALPVQVITRKDIERSGAATVEQLLMSVSAVSSSGGIAAASASGSTTGGISSVSLRGLDSTRTLVLLNGRRIAPYGIGFTGDSVSVDVNSIPLAAVERVEILKDGASAIYGSDAIAGVVNFILRRDYNGGDITVYYGDTTQGGASVARTSITYGFGDLAKDRFNVMLVGSFQKESALFGRDRSFARSGVNEGALNDTTSGNTFPANIFIPFGDPADGGITGNPSLPDCPGPYATVSPLFGPGICRYDPSPQVTLIPKSERSSIFASGKLAINNNLEAFLEASYNRNKQRTVIQPVPLSDQFTLPDTHPLFGTYPYTIPDTDPVFGPYIASGAIAVTGRNTFVLNPSSAYYPTAYVQSLTGGATPPILVRYRAAASGNRDFTDISDAPRLAFGVRGDAGGWDFDTAFLWSQSKVREMVNAGYPALTSILPLLNSGMVNPFGPNTPAVDALIQEANFRGEAFRVKSTLTSVAARGSREIMRLPAGPMALAIGGEFRAEKYDFNASPEIQTGDISGYGGNFLNTSRKRDVKAAFGEINIPILKSLEANAAVRVDDYQGVGRSTTPKVGLRWQPTQSILLRGSAGKGFRAPSLQDLYLPNTLGVTPPGLNDPLRCPTTGSGTDCATQFSITNGGNAGLRPEKSTNLTLGIVLEPVRNVSVSLDAFKIDLKDTIVNGVDAAVILADPVRYASLITRGPGSGGLPGPITNIDQTNINLGQTKVSGIDLDARVTIPGGEAGRFSVNLAGTYFIKYDTQNTDGSFTGGVDRINAATGGVVPRWKHYLVVDWTRGPWTASLAQNFQKGYTDLPGTFEDPTDPAFVPRKVGSYTTWDAQVAYSGFNNWRLVFGIRNLFDRDPPYTNAGGQTSFQGGYDPQYADPRGRFVYASVNYRFK